MTSAVNFARIGAAAAATQQDDILSNPGDGSGGSNEATLNGTTSGGGGLGASSGITAAQAAAPAVANAAGAAAASAAAAGKPLDGSVSSSGGSNLLVGANDVTVRICLVGDEGAGKSSFRACTTQLLQNRPDVAPSLSATCYPYVSKMKTGGRMQLDVIDFGPSAERDLALVRRTVTSSLFVNFVNLSTVKQKVDKGIFSGRTDTVIMHSSVKEGIKRWLNMAYLANPLGCPVLLIGTHKDVLSHQDELALQAVLRELRSVATQATDALNPSSEAAVAAATTSPSSSASGSPPSSATTFLSANCSPPRLYGCYATSCVDHSVVSENPRDGPKKIKELWQFVCELAPKLADRTVQPPAELCLRSSLALLKFERGLRAVSLHDLFLFSLTQGVAQAAMRKALRRRRALGDISVALLRKGGGGSASNSTTSRVSLAMIDLNGTCRLLSTFDVLRRRIAALTGAAESAQSDAAYRHALKRQQQESNNIGGGGSGSGGNNNNCYYDPGSPVAGASAAPASASPSGESVARLLSQLPKMAEEKGEERLYQTIDDILVKSLPAERRDEIHQRGVVAWEVLRDVLAPAFIGGKTCTAEEKAALLWQMTICSGYLIPCVSTLPVADCLLQLNTMMDDAAAAAASVAALSSSSGFDASSATGGANDEKSDQHQQQASLPSSSDNEQNQQQKAASGGSASSPASAAHNQHHYFIFTLPVKNAAYSNSAMQRRRVPPKEAIEEITPPEDEKMLKMFPIKFHYAMRRVVFDNEFSFSGPSQLFALFIGRLVNVANVCLLCPDHVFEGAAWLRCRNNPQSSRLLICADSRNELSLRFVSCAELPLRAHAAFMVEVIQSARAVFDDFELWRLASWVADGANPFVTPKSKFASGPEDMSRLDLSFGTF